MPELTLKVACLVMAYRAPAILQRTVRVYKASGWDVFVHLDSKADGANYREILGDAGQFCEFVQSVEIFWGGFSQVQATLNLINTARRGGRYDRYLFITDDSLPVFPPAYMNSVLGKTGEFISAMGQRPGSPNDERYRRYFYYDHAATMMRDHGTRSTEIDEPFLLAMDEIRALRKTGKKDLILAHGSPYWALSGSAIDVIVQKIESDAHLVSSFKFSPQPDETMIQSIFRSEIATKDLYSQIVYADFYSQNGGPRLLNSIATLPFDLQEHQLFVRKIPPSAVAFARAVTDRLLRGESAWGGPPHSGNSAANITLEDGEVVPISTIRLGAPAEGDAGEAWHGVEVYLDRQFRWTASERVDWVLPRRELPAGRLRIVIPVVIAKPGMLENSVVHFNGEEKALTFTRHSFIAEFEHPLIQAAARITMITPGIVEASPPWDLRSLGLGIAV